MTLLETKLEAKALEVPQEAKKPQLGMAATERFEELCLRGFFSRMMRATRKVVKGVSYAFEETEAGDGGLDQSGSHAGVLRAASGSKTRNVTSTLE